MSSTKVEWFHDFGNKDIAVITEGEYHAKGWEQIISINEAEDEVVGYEIVYQDELIRFYVYEWLSLGTDGNNALNEMVLDLIYWDVMLLDTEAEIFITRNWDVYRIPFRYLLLFGAGEEFENIEFLGNYTPSQNDWVLRSTEIRGKLYDLDKVYQ